MRECGTGKINPASDLFGVLNVCDEQRNIGVLTAATILGPFYILVGAQFTAQSWYSMALDVG